MSCHVITPPSSLGQGLCCRSQYRNSSSIAIVFDFEVYDIPAPRNLAVFLLVAQCRCLKTNWRVPNRSGGSRLCYHWAGDVDVQAAMVTKARRNDKCDFARMLVDCLVGRAHSKAACQDMLRDKHRCIRSLEEQKYCLDILPVFAFSRCNPQLYQSLWDINLTSPISPAYWKVPRKFHPQLRKRQSRGDLTCQCLPAFRSVSPHHVRSFARHDCHFSRFTKILIWKLGSRDVSLNIWRFQEENEVAML